MLDATHVELARSPCGYNAFSEAELSLDASYASAGLADLGDIEASAMYGATPPDEGCADSGEGPGATVDADDDDEAGLCEEVCALARREGEGERDVVFGRRGLSVREEDGGAEEVHT